MSELDAVAEAKRLPTPAEALAEHRIKWLTGYTYVAVCRCGWKQHIHNTGKTLLALHEQHRLDMLREAATVRTVEQLEALPDMAVVRDNCATVWEKCTNYGLPDPWFCTGNEREQPASSVSLPATVLWQPEAVNRG